MKTTASADLLEVRDGRLWFEGVDVSALAHQVETPFYLYSGQRVRDNVQAIVEAFSRRHVATEIFYASKACSNLWFLDRVRRCGVNVEVNSSGELWKALTIGFVPRQILFNGVAKSRGEIAGAVDAGLRGITVDSLFELDRVAAIAAERHRTVAVDLRVDVGVVAHTHPGLVTTGGGKAGIDRDDAVQAFARAAAAAQIDVRGLHVHIGSQVTSVEPYAEAVEVALDLIDDVEASTGVVVERLNCGGGFAVAYREPPGAGAGDYFACDLDAADYAAAICAPVARRRPGLTLFVEPGRAIAGTSALLVTRVENVKTKGVRDAAGRRVGDEQWLLLDAGFNTLLEQTNYDWYYRCVVAGRAAEVCDGEFRLGGPLCDGGDVYAGDGGTALRRLPAATAPGDVIALLDAGAYTLEMMHPYNARGRAAAYAACDGEIVQIRVPESHADLVSHDVDPRPGVGRSHAGWSDGIGAPGGSGPSGSAPSA